MNSETKDKLKLINEIYVATKKLQNLSDDLRYSRENSYDLDYDCEPICVLVTGETGTGKSEFIKKYLAKYHRVEETERTKIPVLVSLLPKARHPKPVVSQLLRDLGDPLGGIGGDTEQLTDRLIILLKGTGTEIIILDEFQHAIETKSNKVVYDIADWIKTLINKAKIPIVLFGLPWSSYVLDVNHQLARRFSMRHELINYTLDDFDYFQMFIQKVQKQLLDKVGIECKEDLWKSDFAFRLFAASSGNISDLMNKVIKPAASGVVRSQERLLTIDHLANSAKRHLGVLNEENPFMIKLKDIVATQQSSTSYWNSEAAKGKSCVVDAKEKEITFSELKLKDVF